MKYIKKGKENALCTKDQRKQIEISSESIEIIAQHA